MRVSPINKVICIPKKQCKLNRLRIARSGLRLAAPARNYNRVEWTVHHRGSLLPFKIFSITQNPLETTLA